MKEMTCIVCPNGCRLKIDDDGNVSGNGCRRGAEFAKAELTHPMRTISSTVKTVFEECPVVPVKTDREIPKEKIFEVMKEIGKVLITERMGIHETIIKNVCDSGADIILTSNILKENQ